MLQSKILFQQTHLKALRDARAPNRSKTAVFLNNKTRSMKRHKLEILNNVSDDCIVREYNFPINSNVGWDGSVLYPSESPLNFSPLRTPTRSVSALDRAVRELPWESKADIIKNRLVKPEWAGPVRGTPRREYQGGMLGGMRVRAVFNPYFIPHGQLRKQYDRWTSRNWENWDPLNVGVRGSTKKYSLPNDIVPQKDELGEWITPKLSGRYQADIKRQYIAHGLPWIYRKDFQTYKMHILDKEPIGPKRWYKREYRLAKIKEAMRGMDNLVTEYRQEQRDAKKKTWFEQIVQKLVGAQTASKYITERKVPKL